MQFSAKTCTFAVQKELNENRPPIADILIDGNSFEVGGRSKGQRQLQNDSKGYIVKDDIETGYNNILPLWAFGLLY